MIINQLFNLLVACLLDVKFPNTAVENGLKCILNIKDFYLIIKFACLMN